MSQQVEAFAFTSDLGPVGSETGREVEVVARTDGAADVIFLTIAASDGKGLPAWAPGAHVDVALGNGLVRQYSLCGDPHDLSTYTIGVLNAPASRGGSRYIHDHVKEGTRLTIIGPRNHFPLIDASRYLFVAGGIGITPIAAMVREVSSRGLPWSLVYGGRTLNSMSLREELESLGGHVTLWPQDTHGIINLTSVLSSPEPDAAVYVCGPEPLIAAVESICGATWPSGSLHFERFAPKPLPVAVNEEFEVELARSGRRVTVPADTSVLDALAESGVHILHSCGEGTCGTCETGVLAGVVDHRDSVLTADEQARNDCMMVCVSRANCQLLVLDL